MKEMLFNVVFTHSNERWEDRYKNIKRYVEDEFIRLRNIAVKDLNPMYAIWNEEFEKLGVEVDENDELKDFGGTKYCEFISSRQNKILDDVNKKHSRDIWHFAVELYSDETCDICARLMYENIIVDECHLELEPVKN